MTDLSPAAQAIFWEFNRAASGKPDDWHYLPAIAAALRAAADQVVPEDYDPPRTAFYPEAGAFVDGKKCRNEDVRYHFLAIAAELEGSDD